MICSVRSTFHELTERHYLGPTKAAGFGWQDEFGVMVFAAPRSRRLPADSWFELVRWCLSGEQNAGSRQWSRFAEYATAKFPGRTTVVSYSDPSEGHTGALYRACNWLWAPTWLRLRPPPSGHGAWSEDGDQGVKDRWVYPLRPDPARAAILRLNDESLERKMPWAGYREPTWGKHGRFRPATGGGDFKRFRSLADCPPASAARR